jgi:hypothetical protein
MADHLMRRQKENRSFAIGTIGRKTGLIPKQHVRKDDDDLDDVDEFWGSEDEAGTSRRRSVHSQTMKIKSTSSTHKMIEKTLKRSEDKMVAEKQKLPSSHLPLAPLNKPKIHETNMKVKVTESKILMKM